MKILIFAVTSAFLFLAGCTSSQVVPYYSSDSYKDHLNQDLPTAPVLIQYRFVNPVEDHELFFLNELNERYFVHVEDVAHAAQGFVINLPAGHSYALASIYLYVNKQKKEIALGKMLPLFPISQEYLTRLRGFDIINDENPKSRVIALAPWDPKTDQSVALQSARRLNLPEKSVRTIDIFKR